MRRTTSRARRPVAALAAIGSLAIALTACTSSQPSDSSGDGSMSLWIWPGGLSETVVETVTAESSGLEVSVIGDDFKQKLLTVFTAKSDIPDITGVKGEDMPYFLQEPELFTDLNTLDIDDIVGEFPEWKLAEATTPDGRLLGLPIDIGPAGLFYREDILAGAGMPTDPAEVEAATSTYEDYFTFGEQLKAATGAHLEVSAGGLFGKVMGQSETKFVSPEGEFLGESDAVRNAWDLAVEAWDRGLVAGIEDGSPDWASAVNAGALPMLSGAAWYAGDIKSNAADTTGLWRVTQMPGGPANIGGSFLTIPAAAEDKEAALEVIKALLSPENEAVMYTETGNFPARTTTFEQPGLHDGDDFFGGQDTVSVFVTAAENMPTVYNSPLDNQVAAPYYTELRNVETGKDPEQAWADAVAAAKEALESS
ncbi:ABC transporter substrate-binding protein [Antribacter sp. KLBMP9083]|uniref:ABC transporter substrate-binding protein n=1 Tax=Antribacter soli TaxID=2910976 RepID=A0AA41QAD1_9MICO|nr:ABC transporter substrate-binding protein [Antribacter soli]MCF4119800.1 ABC transporter substrate-binding protein [Antribacter soli]